MTARNRGRAINITNSEITIILWLIGFIMAFICFKLIFNLWINYPTVIEFTIMMFLLPMSIFWFFMAATWLPYLISKWNLYLFTDKISNPDYIGWLRYTKSKSFRSHLVPRGPLGQTMGMMSGEKADVINQGDYTVTLPNGNQAIIAHDMSSVNINLEDNENWEMIKKHHWLFGFNAWDKAVDVGETLHKMEDVLKAMEELEKPEEPKIEETTDDQV